MDYKISPTDVLRLSLFRSGDMSNDQRDDTLSETEAQLIENIRQLIETHRITQAEFAERIGRSQPWVSKRMSKSENRANKNKWKIEDLDDLYRVFQLAPWELLRPGHGRLDRRKIYQRRTGRDRRTSHQGENYRHAATGLTSAIISTQSAIDAANALYELAEHIHAIARALLGRQPPALSDLQAGGVIHADPLGRSTGGSGTKKTG